MIYIECVNPNLLLGQVPILITIERIIYRNYFTHAISQKTFFVSTKLDKCTASIMIIQLVPEIKSDLTGQRAYSSHMSTDSLLLPVIRLYISVISPRVFLVTNSSGRVRTG